jgi:hypothetical protein
VALWLSRFLVGVTERWRRLEEEGEQLGFQKVLLLLIRGRGGPEDGEKGDVEKQGLPLPDMWCFSDVERRLRRGPRTVSVKEETARRWAAV